MGKYDVCGRCDGEGVVVNPAIRTWTGSDIAEDPEGFEMMRRGVFDVECPQCHGKRVTTAQDLEAYNDYVESARTRAMESGDYETLMNRAW